MEASPRPGAPRDGRRRAPSAAETVLPEDLSRDLGALAHDLAGRSGADEVDRALAERMERITRRVRRLTPSAQLLYFDAGDAARDAGLVRALAGAARGRSACLRLASLRLARHLLRSERAVLAFLAQRFDLVAICAMEGARAPLWERAAALKWTRRVMEAAPSRMPASLVQSVACLCRGNREDALRGACVETLRVFAVADTALVARCNGIKELFDAALDPRRRDLAEPLLATLLFLLDGPERRRFLRPRLALQRLVTTFTDLDAADAVSADRWRTARGALVAALRSFAGLYLLAGDPGALRSVLSLLPDASVRPATQHAVMDAALEAFDPLGPLLALDAAAAEAESAGDGGVGVGGALRRAPASLLDPYAALLAGALLHCGLLPGLAALGLRSDRGLAAKANRLLVLTLRVARRAFPAKRCAALWAMAPYVDTAIGSTTPAPPGAPPGIPSLDVSTRAFRTLELLSAVGGAAAAPAAPAAPAEEAEDLAGLVALLARGASAPARAPRASRAAQRAAAHAEVREDIRRRVDASGARGSVREHIARSNVEATKVWQNWDWARVAEALDALRVSPARLPEALRGKFLRRLGGFYRCQVSDRAFFAALPWRRENLRYARCACLLYGALVSHEAGREFLRADRRGALLREIAAELEAAVAEGPHASVLLSPQALSQSMAREYLGVVGALSRTEDGRRALGEAKIPELLRRASASAALDHITKLALARLDYSAPSGPGRALLGACAAGGSPALRLHAASVLRALLREEAHGLEHWGVDALLSLVASPSPRAARAALLALEEASASERFLRAIVDRRPPLAPRRAADALLARLASSEPGLDHLTALGWIDGAISRWRGDALLAYAAGVERAVARALSGGREAAKAAGGDAAAAGAGPPPRSAGAPIPAGGGGGAAGGGALRQLLGLPWGASVRVLGAAGDLEAAADVLLDAADADPPAAGGGGGVRARVVLCDAATGLPRALEVGPQDTVEVSLRVGARPVDRFGCLARPTGEWSLRASDSFYASNPSYAAYSASHRPSTARVSDVEDMAPPPPSPRAGAPGRVLSDDASADAADWSACAPADRAAQVARLLGAEAPAEANGDEFWIAAEGSPARWIFGGYREARGAGFRGSWRLAAVEFVLQVDPPGAGHLPVPTHLLGEVAKTAAGCARLRSSGAAEQMLRLARGRPADMGDALRAAPPGLRRRAALWACGHMGASESGWALLEGLDPSFADWLLGAATQEGRLGLKGTCFSALGLLARSAPGARALAASGWEPAATPGVAVCVPEQLGALFPAPEQRFDGAPAGALEDAPPVSKLAALMTEEEREVYESVSQLSNRIQQREASARLQRLSRERPAPFSSPRLLLLVHTMLASYRFSLQTRRFALGLFHGKAQLDPAALDDLLRRAQ